MLQNAESQTCASGIQLLERQGYRNRAFLMIFLANNPDRESASHALSIATPS